MPSISLLREVRDYDCNQLPNFCNVYKPAGTSVHRHRKLSESCCRFYLVKIIPIFQLHVNETYYKSPKAFIPSLFIFQKILHLSHIPYRGQLLTHPNYVSYHFEHILQVVMPAWGENLFHGFFIPITRLDRNHLSCFCRYCFCPFLWRSS